jgi:hypothetical protein
MGCVVVYGTVPSDPRHKDGSIPLHTAIEDPEIQPPSKARVSLYSPECVKRLSDNSRTASLETPKRGQKGPEKHRFGAIRATERGRSRVPQRFIRQSRKVNSPKFESTFRLVCRWAILELTSTKGGYGLLVQRCDPPKSQGVSSCWSRFLL